MEEIMSDNMAIWNKFSRPPKEALREIKAGRLSGMTDVNPQWRLEAMTETFGPVGIGWTYTIEKLWYEPVNEGQTLAFALVNVKVNYGGTWSEAIPGIGGSMLVTKEKSGLHASDEGYKMAVTDALSVALKALGVGADIYRGRWDGSKYKNTPQESKPAKEVVAEYVEEAQKVFDPANIPTTADLQKEMSEYFIQRFGSDAAIEFEKMTNKAFSDPFSIKVEKNVILCYKKFQEYKEASNAKH
jgi:hypothetical protein